MRRNNGLDRLVASVQEPVATIFLKRWIAGIKKDELQVPVMFRRLDVLEVHGETPKSVDVTVRFNSEVASNCNICGLELKTEVSRVTGIGPVCAVKIGVPRKLKGEADVILETLTRAASLFGSHRMRLPKSQFKIESGELVAPPREKKEPVIKKIGPNQVQIKGWFAEKNGVPDVLTLKAILKETDKWALVVVAEKKGRVSLPKSVVLTGELVAPELTDLVVANGCLNPKEVVAVGRMRYYGSSAVAIYKVKTAAGVFRTRLNEQTKENKKWLQKVAGKLEPSRPTRDNPTTVLWAEI